MRKIPLTRPFFGDEEVEKVRECLESGWVTQGPMVAEFERRMAIRHQIPYALATTSCTAALHLAMLALDLRPGDEVIVPAFTWVTSANCAEYVGAKPVFADVESSTFNLDPRAFESAISPRTRAVIVVHLFGLAARMDEILEVARRHHVDVIEDAACAIGTEYGGVPVGGLGLAGCFSFHPRKVITTGEGGMVTTRHAGFAETVASYRNHGCQGTVAPGPGKMARPYEMSQVIRVGYNLRLSDIQGAVGIAQMDRLDELLAERLSWAMRYTERLKRYSDLVFPAASKKCGHTYQSYVIRMREGGVKRRNMIMEKLAEKGIWSRPGTHAVHRLQVYQDKYKIRPLDFPVACASEDETITLPIFPGMMEKDWEHVVDVLEKAMGQTVS